MSVSGVQLPKPKDWQSFERMARELFACVLRDPNTQMHGRTGQPQHGVDIYGCRERHPHQWVGVQCKLSVDPINEFELRDELKKASNFVPAITEFHLVTTAPRDAKIQEVVRKLTMELSASARPFAIRVWGWEDLEEEAAKHKAAHKAFDPTWNPYAETAHRETRAEIKSLHETLETMAQSQPAHSVSAHDVQLFQDFKQILGRDVLHLLAMHDFGNPFRVSVLNPLDEISLEWLGARYEFVDPEIQSVFESVMTSIHAFLEIIGARIFTMDSKPHYGWPKTDVDQKHGLTQRTREGIKDMNTKAHELWRAIDVFERVAGAKLTRI